MKKVLFIHSIHPKGMDYLRKNYEVVITEEDDEEKLAEIIQEYHAVVTRLTPINKNLIERGIKLEAIAKHGVGTDNIDVEEAKSRGIEIITTGNANSNSVAEHVIFGLGALSRKMNKFDVGLREGRWDMRDSVPIQEFSGKKIGIVGFGRIGRRVAQIANGGFGAEVYVFDPYIEKADVEKEGYRYLDDLDELCSMSDYITLHVPFTEENRGLIDRRRIALMKPTVYIANLSRGGVVNEEDLYIGLKEQRIGGAVVDVFEEEPPEKNLSLFGLENIIVSPHCAAFSNEAKEKMSMTIAKGIEEVLQRA